MPPEGESLETIESIRNAKRKAAELVDTTLSLINSEALDTAGSYYLKALEEVGKIKILQAMLGNEIGTFVENTRDLRIQAAHHHHDHLGREHDVSSVVKKWDTLHDSRWYPRERIKKRRSIFKGQFGILIVLIFARYDFTISPSYRFLLTECHLIACNLLFIFGIYIPHSSS